MSLDGEDPTVHVMDDDRRGRRKGENRLRMLPTGGVPEQAGQQGAVGA